MDQHFPWWFDFVSRWRFQDGAADQDLFDQHTTLVHSTTNEVVFVTQAGDVLRRNPLDPKQPWKVSTDPAGSRPIFNCIDGEGTLWLLNRQNHILQFINGTFRELPNDGGLSKYHINLLVADSHGVVWAGADHMIARWNGTAFEDASPTNSTWDIKPTMMVPMRSGAMWVLDGEQFRKMEGRAWTAEATAWRGLLASGSGRVTGAHEDREGGLWLNHYGNGLFHVTPDGRYQWINTESKLPGDRVGAWFQSSDGGIWAGITLGGLVRLRDRRFTELGMEEGLPARTALSVCGESNGAVWIGTAGGGLCCWKDAQLSHFSIGKSASANFVFAIATRKEGGLWLSASDGEDLFQLDDGKIKRAPWDVHGVKSLLEDRQGTLWLGLKSGLAWVSLGEQTVLNSWTNKAQSAIRALTEAPDGSIWAGMDDGTILHGTRDKKFESFHASDELAGQPIYSILADSTGTIWAGTFRGGLVRLRDGNFSRINSKQGMPVDVIGQIQDDHAGRLWLGTHKGMFCVSKAALDACLDGKSGTMDYTAYSRHDGLPALEFSDGYQPASWRGSDGRLWFTTSRGVATVNPETLIAKSPPPRVLLEELNVDGLSVPLNGSDLVVPPGKSQYDFRFTALTFEAGDRARFRYRLEGFDSVWVDADMLRVAHYGPLPPRKYRFHVIACNSDGVWNDVGAALNITVEPHFYETKWFLFLISAVVISGISLAVRRVATRKYRLKLAEMERQNAIERDRARIAKDIHDDIGAGLTQITLLTELARREPEQIENSLERITRSARNLTKAMDEIVWAVDPQQDTFSGLMDYISAYCEDFLRVARIRCRMDLPVSLPDLHVDAELRYNLFLAVKESVNNVVKHSGATEVWLRLILQSGQFILEIEDNGLGIDPESVSEDPVRLNGGNGIGNLAGRLKVVGGSCEISSAPGKGTLVRLTVRVAPLASPKMGIDHEAVVE